jgi:transcription antitermination factor NusG
VQLNSVRYCPGILAPVAFSGRLAIVEQEMIDALVLREGERGYVLPDEEAHGIPEGATVRVMTGALEGIKGVFKGYLRGGERARILMDFLRARHEVEIDAAALAMLRA